MQIVSTVREWLELADIPRTDDRVAAWTTSYEAAFPSIFDVYYSAWGDPERRRDAAERAPLLKAQVLAAEARARLLLDRAEDSFRSKGLLNGEELGAVLIVGGHTSNGWVAEHQGRPTLFLALEFLGLPPYDDLLVVHELTHVAQGQLSAATRARTYPASLAAVVEGAATATCRLLRPGHTDSAYLWMDDHHAEWLDSCRASAQAIASLLLVHPDTLDEDEAVAPLFRNRTNGVVPARAGYWAGDLIVREMLQQGATLRDALSVAPPEARERVLEWAARSC